jgi:hypothetical protein
MVTYRNHGIMTIRLIPTIFFPSDCLFTIMIQVNQESKKPRVFGETSEGWTYSINEACGHGRIEN